MSNTGRSHFDVYMLCTAWAVIVGDAITLALIAPDGCSSIIGLLLWIPVTAFFAAMVLLPAIVRRLFVARLSRVVVRVLAGAVVATAVPALLATVLHDKNLQHCIS